MRVRELLAANAFCLLAATYAGCAKVEQPVGEYSIVDAHPARPTHPQEEPARSPRPPASASSEPEAGVTVSPLVDAGNTDPIIEPTRPPPSGTGAAGRPSTLAPPVLVDAGPMSVPDDPACRLQDAERRRLDMYLMVDNNVTLSIPGTAIWETMTNGLISFVNDTRSRGTGVGIRYFGNTCDAEDYAVPTVEIANLPSNALQIASSTRGIRWNASPMLPALEGALMHQKSRASKYDAKQAVLLVSDGVSFDATCSPYTTQMLAEAARTAATQAPFVETHVIAVGVDTMVSQPLDALIELLGAFNTIAEAGGTGEAITTSITGDSAEFAEALQRARRNAAPCEYKAPPGMGVDDFRVLRYPALMQVPRVANERNCGLREGWYYATESEPTPVTLCPETCSRVRDEDNQKIQFSFCTP